METSNPAVAERLRNDSCLSVVCFNSTIRQAQSSIRISYFRFRFTAVYNKLLTPAPVQLQGHVVESTDRFAYLGSDIHSSERSPPAAKIKKLKLLALTHEAEIFFVKK